MIAVDTNILLYADREETPQHRAALRALRRLAEGHEAWAIPIQCVGEFLRVVSHDRVFQPPTPIGEALASIESLLASPSARVLVPGGRYLRILREVIERAEVRGNLVFDAQIAAVCLEHGATTLLTEDRDFTRFQGLKPLSLAAFLAD
ncbi:MAG: PIN domain-containing protein [Planctomycetota bacterium]|jgi:toxin-antitoxin system PIN domain toxin|nr:PIN domain-containing protein [Planctomycetota bacterium]